MRYLHTMIRVGNLDTSIKFYTEALGFRQVSRAEHPEGKFTLVFLRAGSDAEGGPMLELTYNWGVETYDIGKGYGHMAFRVESMDAVGESLKKGGYSFSWGPGLSPNKKRAMAFVKDPDGYQIELLEGKD